MPNRLWSAWQEFGKDRKVRRLLTGTERMLLEARREQIAPWVAPYHPHEIDAVALAVGEMLESFPASRMSEEGAVGRMDSLRHFLADQPAWAIIDACRKIRERGYERDGKFERHWPPSDAELLVEVKQSARLYRDTYDSAVNLLAAAVEE